jgi:PKD repeat protein
MLPAGKYEVPSSVTIPDGAGDAPFNFSVDLDYLVANPTKKFAIGVAVSTAGKKTGANRLAVLLIDASFLVPVANFTTSITGRTVSFSNTSVNGVSYTWNYGDGSALSTAAAATYTYTAAGTYMVTLTATGALGASNPSVKTATVTVL